MNRWRRRTPRANTPAGIRIISLTSPSASTASANLRLRLFQLLDELELLRHFGCLSADFLIAVEVDVPVDEHLLDLGVVGQRVFVIDHEVGVFPDVDRPDTIVNAKLARGIDGYHGERFGLRRAAVF